MHDHLPSLLDALSASASQLYDGVDKRLLALILALAVSANCAGPGDPTTAAAVFVVGDLAPKAMGLVGGDGGGPWGIEYPYHLDCRRGCRLLSTPLESHWN